MAAAAKSVVWNACRLVIWGAWHHLARLTLGSKVGRKPWSGRLRQLEALHDPYKLRYELSVQHKFYIKYAKQSAKPSQIFENLR